MEEMIVSIPDASGVDAFREMNTRKVPWDERLQTIKREFPSISRLDWYAAFKADPELMGRLINDILKVDAAEPGKPGKRKALVGRDARDRLNRLTGEDWTVLPFTDSFKVLAGDRSIRHLASKIGLDRNVVHRLLKGGTPSADQIEKVARAFGKAPEYFVEYRINFVMAVIYHRLTMNPESSVVIHHKVKQAMKEGESLWR